MTLHKGPREPDWCRRARDLYWEPCLRLRGLEERLCSTDAGMAWFYRMRDRTAARPSRAVRALPVRVVDPRWLVAA